MQLRARTILFGSMLLAAVAPVVLLAENGLPIAQSPEVHFADSTHGLSLVPASCPSNPHYAGECGATPTGGCTISAAPGSIAPGGSATLSWNVYPFTGITGWFVQIVPKNTVINPGVGAVPTPSGAIAVTPSVTTSYTLSGEYRVVSTFFYNNTLVGTFSCTATVGVSNASPNPNSNPNSNSNSNSNSNPNSNPNPSIIIDSGPDNRLPGGVGGSLCTARYYCGSDGNIWYTSAQCVPSLFQLCPAGCVTNNGVPSCIVVPSAIVGVFKAMPSLVRAGSPVTVSWQVNNAASCNISGTNGDQWNCVGSQCGVLTSRQSSPIQTQTKFTLHCLQLRGATGIWSDQTATVNIIPTYQER